MKIFAPLLLILGILSGCVGRNPELEQAADLRTKLLASNGCSFEGEIVADYGDILHTFQMSCEVDNTGRLDFTVTAPETISGITGYISQEGANLTFKEKVLAFPMLADGEISPVCAPWLFINSLRGGYISGCSKDADGLHIYLDDSFFDNPIKIEVKIDQNSVPTHCEFIWQNRRILSLKINNFDIL